MKKLFTFFYRYLCLECLLTSCQRNFSKYQAHYSFRCEQAENVLKRLINIWDQQKQAMNLEVDFYAYEHQGWNGATHQVSFIIRMQIYAMAEMFIQLPESALCSEIQ